MSIRSMRRARMRSRARGRARGPVPAHTGPPPPLIVAHDAEWTILDDPLLGKPLARQEYIRGLMRRYLRDYAEHSTRSIIEHALRDGTDHAHQDTAIIAPGGTRADQAVYSIGHQASRVGRSDLWDIEIALTTGDYRRYEHLGPHSPEAAEAVRHSGEHGCMGAARTYRVEREAAISIS